MAYPGGFIVGDRVRVVGAGPVPRPAKAWLGRVGEVIDEPAEPGYVPVVFPERPETAFLWLPADLCKLVPADTVPLTEVLSRLKVAPGSLRTARR